MNYPAIDPVAFHLGSWPVYWYGLMYLIGFLGGWALLALRLRASPRGFNQQQLSDIVFYAALGAIVGGRIGYVLFYDWPIFIQNPLVLFKTWQGGMSFHGGLLGVVIAMWICTKKFHKTFLELTDLIAPVIPIGLGAGRIGNFINGELWGRATDVPWGMVFPQGGEVLRHPSQLYEFALEGIVLFIILWLFSTRLRPVGAVSGLFAILYASFRIFIEFFREPDVQIGYLWGGITEGQLLSIPLLLVGIVLYWRAYQSEKKRVRHETVS